jgi:hypothetical protein
MAQVKCKCPDKGYGNWYIGRDCPDCKTQIRAFRVYRKTDKAGNLKGYEEHLLPLRGCRKCGERYPFGKRY